MAGRVVRQGDDVCFVPRFAFVAGTAYDVAVDGEPVATLVRPALPHAASTVVLAVHPTAAEVPRNLLRLYVEFSGPMAEGGIARHVHVRPGHGGGDLEGAFLPTDTELWDPERRRVTVMFDPARIKRGLLPHREVGYALTPGASIEVVVDAGLRDAAGRALTGGRTRRYRVGPDVREHVDPGAWEVVTPTRATVDALLLRFPRPLDHALLRHSIGVAAGGAPVAGTVAIGEGEQQWSFTPASAWNDRDHEIVVDPVLEDLAGNSLTRVFDRDLDDPAHSPRPARPGVLPFRPS